MNEPTPVHVRVRVVVSGRVQGVWFRDSCRDEARLAAVSGWVANRGDGGVEAVFEGPPAAVAGLVEWCRSGPARAQVTGIEVGDESPIGEVGFSVR